MKHTYEAVPKAYLWNMPMEMLLEHAYEAAPGACLYRMLIVILIRMSIEHAYKDTYEYAYKDAYRAAYRVCLWKPVPPNLRGRCFFGVSGAHEYLCQVSAPRQAGSQRT